MKKILFGLITLVATIVSCTDQEDIEIAYKSGIGITAAHIFDDYEQFQDGDFDMSKEGWKLHLSVFVYDESGKLVDKSEQLCDKISESLSYTPHLIPGNYTVVSIADFREGLGGNGYRFWYIENESNIQDLSITENDSYFPVVFETLGIDVQKIEITNESKLISADIKPITSLVHVYMSDKDYSGWGVDGYSRFSVLTAGYYIKAIKAKNNVRFENGEVSYKYSEQQSSYNLAKSNVYNKWKEKSAPTTYCYRALLPENDKVFSFNIQKRELPEDYYNTYVLLCGEFETSGQCNTLSSIESNKQYVVNMILDAMQLVAFEYPTNYPHEDFTLKYVQDYKVDLMNQMVDFGYEQIVGLPEKTLNTYLQSTPYSYNETETVAYYPRSNSRKFESFITVRYTSSSRDTSNRIMLQLPNMTDEMIDSLVQKLGEKFTLYSHVGNIYQFTDKATVAESKCGIILKIASLPSSEYSSYDNCCLYFDIIK